MDKDRFARVEALFREALLSEPEDFGAFLDERCGDDPAVRRQVEALIAAHREADTFLEPGPASGGAAAGAGGLEGRMVGAYRIVRRIGGGGMGVVYLAERADDAFRKRIAIKVLPPGEGSEDIVRRFTTERQILAALEHPNIARLLDGGATEEGRPYFALEYVEGKPIDAYCEDRRLGVRERLELFLTLCDAVQFAHANLIVHRDLKPGNVLVTGDGVPKLLDFGIAKLLNPELASRSGATISFLRMLTPDYASPEQVEGGPITTATDVYSLGILLYRLLTGRRPYALADSSPAEMVDAICRRVPEPPSAAVMRPREEAESPGSGPPGGGAEGTARRAGDRARLRRALAGDLDAIVGKALRKMPERRYPSVALLAEDVRRHLQGLPVRARRGTLAYRAGKFARRWRWPLAATAAVLVALLALGARLAWEKSRAEAALAVAEVERARAEQTTSLLVELFQLADPLRPGELDAREILERAAMRVERGGFPDPAVRAGMQRTIGVAFRNLGLPDRAIPLLEASLALERAGGDRRAELETLHELAIALYEAGDLDAAEDRYRQSLTGFRAAFGDRHPTTGRALNDLAALRFQQGRVAEAEALFEQALAIRREPDAAPADLAETLNNLAAVRARSDPEGAEALFREALAIRRRHFGPGHVMVANTQQHLARLLRRQGRAAEALPLAGDALAAMRDNLLPGDWRISVVETVVGGCLADLGRRAEAEPLLLGAYENLSRSTGPTAGATRQALEQLVALYEAWGRPERAAEYRAPADRPGP